MSRTHSSRHRTFAALTLGIALAGVAFSAMATRSPDDRKVALDLLAGQSSATPATSHAIGQAQHALQRADQARSAGDQNHARTLDGLAKEWAEMARDISRTTSAEQRADKRQRAAASAALDVRKTHALIEAIVARRARAEGELHQAHATSSAVIPAAALSAARLRPIPSSNEAAPAGSK